MRSPQRREDDRDRTVCGVTGVLVGLGAIGGRMVESSLLIAVCLSVAVVLILLSVTMTAVPKLRRRRDRLRGRNQPVAAAASYPDLARSREDSGASHAYTHPVV